MPDANDNRETPWLERRSPSAGVLGCIAWFVLACLVLGLVVITVGSAGFFFDGGPLPGLIGFGIVVGAGACFLVFVGKAMGKTQKQDTFRLFDDRVEVLGEDRELCVPYARIGHFHLSRGGRIRFYARGDLDACAASYVFVTRRLQAEDEFDRWMDRVELCNPSGLYSINQHGTLTHSRAWTLEDVLGDLGVATSARFERRCVVVGAHRLPLRGHSGWTLRLGGEYRLRVRGEPCVLMNAAGVVLSILERYAGGRRFTLGEHGRFDIPEYKGELKRDDTPIGRVEFTYSRASIETTEPRPAVLLALLLVTGLYPNFYVLEA